jgi:hypothetical protein
MIRSGGTQPGSKLFVCTKPYQYMVARLIKEGCAFENCDLMVLHHFLESGELCSRVEQTGVWNRVMHYDDNLLNQYKSRLNPLEKIWFYRTWNKFVPDILPDVSAYSEVFLAHDGVAAEYAIMREFQRAGKPVHIYEEGFGSYIDTNTHRTIAKKFMKKCSPLLGLPGGYIGGLKWIQSVWVQYPELLAKNGGHPLRRKARRLPMRFKDFMRKPEIVGEWFAIYPELHKLDQLMQGEEVVSIVLTDSWLDSMPDREAFVEHAAAMARETTGGKPSCVYVKQHPGELLSLREKPGLKLLPQKLPIELLYLVMLKNRLSKVHLFSFGSTAVLNLSELCRDADNLDIYIFTSLNIAEEYKIIAARFRELAARCQVQYRTV